jgi:hypothetical protein
MGAAMVCATPVSFNQSPDRGLSTSLNSAEARIGRPLTPGSVAGVNRRVHREHIADARMVLLATELCDQRPPSTRRLLVRKAAERWQVSQFIKQRGNREPFSHSNVCWGNYRSGGLNVGVGMALPGQ